MKKRFNFCLLLMILSASSMVSFASPNFSDIKNHWAEDSILKVAELGLMKGYTNNTFAPKSTVSREELAAVISRLAEEFDISAPEVPNDVKGRWSENAVAKSTALNLIAPIRKNVFIPTQKVTRQDVVHTICKLFELKRIELKSESKDLTDIDDAMYQSEIRQIAAIGIMRGDSNGKFFPDKRVTRAELAAILLRINDILGGAQEITPAPTPMLSEPTASLPKESREVALASGTKSVTGSFVQDQGKRVLELVNAERTKAGLKPLTWSDDLAVGADIRAVETCVLFSHDRPNGKDCFSLPTGLMAENIAEGHTTAEHVMRDWMKSSGHRANIMRSEYTEMAASLFIDSSNTTHWIQHFR